jgi:hypothetical protein
MIFPEARKGEKGMQLFNQGRGRPTKDGK